MFEEGMHRHSCIIVTAELSTYSMKTAKSVSNFLPFHPKMTSSDKGSINQQNSLLSVKSS